MPPGAGPGRVLARHRGRTVALLLAVGATLAGAVLVADRLGALHRADLATVDARFAVRGERPAPRGVVLVAIDDQSFADLRRRWQDWPRTFHARVLRRLAAARPRVVAYDVQFTEPSTRAADLALFDAAGAARPVVLATDETDGHGGSGVLGGDRNLRAIGARAGNVQLPADPGGAIRQVPAAVDGLTSFALATASVAAGRPLRPPGGRRAWIDYAGGPGAITTVPFWRVFRGRVPASAFRDRVVVVGAVAPTLQDLHPTSVGGDALMSGAEIQANAIATALAGFPLRRGPAWLDTLLLLTLGMTVPVALAVLRPWAAALATAAVLGAFLLVAQAAFDDHGTILAVAPPIVALAVGGAGAVGTLAATELRERRRLRTLFARFVPASVVDEVVDRLGGEARLGGERRDATVLFADLRGFTSFAENLPAERVIDVLNRYLGEMSEAILGHGGTLVAYMGDGIMAVFGAPLAQEDHADRALAAAREMAGPRLATVNAWLGEHGLPGPFRIGVGLCSGPVMSGNVGSARRLEYTAIGDTTNTAARLEGLTKEHGCAVLLAGSTRERLRRPGEAGELRCLGELSVRGRRAALTVWTIEQAHDPSAPVDGRTIGAVPDGTPLP